MVTAKRATLDSPAACRRCPRLVAYRKQNRKLYPDFHNAPVGQWGEATAPLLIVGLAPGLKGANRTGQPFTGDASGTLLFEVMLDCGLAEQGNDGLILRNCAITNAVACVPPENRPTGAELNNCRPYLAKKLTSGPKAVLALGGVAHDAVLRALGLKVSEYPFSHGSDHALPVLHLISSYHPSRYNVATKRIDFERLKSVMSVCAEVIGSG